MFCVPSRRPFGEKSIGATGFEPVTWCSQVTHLHRRPIGNPLDSALGLAFASELSCVIVGHVTAGLELGAHQPLRDVRSWNKYSDSSKKNRTIYSEEVALPSPSPSEVRHANLVLEGTNKVVAVSLRV